MNLQGSLINRIEEQCEDCDNITVGTGATEFSYSDRHPYEVVSVEDQKHVSIRPMDHESIEESKYGSNNWKLISNEHNPVIRVVKRGKYWYIHNQFKAENFSDTPDDRLTLALAGVSYDELRDKSVVNRYIRMNIRFGFADYYYDPEF